MLSFHHWCRQLSRRSLRDLSLLLNAQRNQSSSAYKRFQARQKDNNTFYYAVGTVVGGVGVTFLAVPLYRIFCEQTSFGGLAQVAGDLEKVAKMEKVEDRLIRVRFNADVTSSMQWNFKPMQREVYVHPGETVLVFYTAKNPTNKPIIGISSYNITPFQAAYYFNKIQCFCFEEQILDPGEEVELPVFFYIDPEFALDPDLQHINQLLLSYTFYDSKTNKLLPSPFDPSNRPSVTLEQLDSSSKLPTPSAAAVAVNLGS